MEKLSYDARQKGGRLNDPKKKPVFPVVEGFIKSDKNPKNLTVEKFIRNFFVF